MSIRERIAEYSKGNSLDRFWKLFRRRGRAGNRFICDVLTFRLNRIANRHGGYIGNGAVFYGMPSLPHGLHGIYISRYASIGENCRIYQNVTIGEVEGSAPKIGNNCLIGAGAVVIGGISIGNNVKIGAGAVVSSDIADNCTVVSQPPRIIKKEEIKDVDSESEAVIW